MTAAAVVLVLFLLILAFGLVNYWSALRVEKAQQAWFRERLPPGVSLEDFLEAAPYTFKPLVNSRGYGIIDRRSGEEVGRAKTPEEAQAWIVLQTLAERGASLEA